MLPLWLPRAVASWLMVAGCWPSANSSRCRSGCPRARYWPAEVMVSCSSGGSPDTLTKLSV